MSQNNVEKAETEVIGEIELESLGSVRLERFLDENVNVTTVGADNLSVGEYFFISRTGDFWTVVVTLDEFSDFGELRPDGVRLRDSGQYCSLCGETGQVQAYYYTSVHGECVDQFMEGCSKLVEQNSDTLVSKNI